METEQYLNVAGTVILGEYPKCESSRIFIAENLYTMFKVFAFGGGGGGILRSAK
jgi:hypothetical protein